MGEYHTVRKKITLYGRISYCKEEDHTVGDDMRLHCKGYSFFDN